MKFLITAQVRTAIHRSRLKTAEQRSRMRTSLLFF
jgi:hypothetical protein